jgi:hypothetical protein
VPCACACAVVLLSCVSCVVCRVVCWRMRSQAQGVHGNVRLPDEFVGLRDRDVHHAEGRLRGDRRPGRRTSISLFLFLILFSISGITLAVAVSCGVCGVVCRVVCVVMARPISSL